MSKNKYYYYDHETCTFVEVKPRRTKLYTHGALTLVAAFLLAGAISWVLDARVDSPQEIALRTENEALQKQLATVSSRMRDFSKELAQLSEHDQDLYRTLLQAEPISDDVRQMGVGGADAYEQFSRFGPSTASVLRQSARMLDELERKIGLQNTSYRELTRLAAEREEALTEMPAILPTDGPVVSGYGMRRHPILKVRKMHAGIDILVETGTPVVAAGDGIVTAAKYSTTYGNYVEVKHPAAGLSTRYAHLSKIMKNIRPGTRVRRGETLALSGSTGRATGPHLHYEVRDAKGHTLNPIRYFAPSMTPQEYKKLLEQSQKMTSSLD